MRSKKVIILGGDSESTRIVFNYLSKKINISHVVIEDSESRKKFLKRRIRRLGYFTVFGQILFQLIIVKSLSLFSKNRKRKIMSDNDLNNDDIPEQKLLKVPSVNSEQVIELLKEINPDVIVVNGTRIISKKIIQNAGCKLINTHAGITPKYRGVHGGYWALANDDAENCGVTVHYIDEGIDTGSIIFQSIITPTKSDNFVTYPLLQLAKGLIILEKAIENEFENKNSIISNNLESKLWYHPTFFQYLYNYIVKNVK